MESFNFYDKSQHFDRPVFAQEMFSRWSANRILLLLLLLMFFLVFFNWIFIKIQAEFLFFNYVQKDVFTLISSYSAFIKGCYGIQSVC